MKNLLTVILLFTLAFTQRIEAQVVWVEPANPGIHDSITVFYNAAEGNQSLKGYTESVYFHTGIISSKSIDGHDWKYVVGNWGTADRRVLMTRVKTDLYRFKMVISSFYGLRPEDKANQLAFVFRNEDGTLVGKTKENEDILVPVNGYIPPAKPLQSKNRQVHKFLSLEKFGNEWMIKTGNETTAANDFIFIEPYTEDIVRVRYSPRFITKGSDSSDAVILKPREVKSGAITTKNGFVLESGNFRILIDAEPFRLVFVYQGDTLLREESGFFSNQDYTGMRFAYPADEKIYGLGERALQMDRRGREYQLYNRPFYGYEEGAAMLNYSLPLTFSSKKYALLFDNPQKAYISVGKREPDVIEWGAIGGEARYFIVAAHSYPMLTENYTLLTGRQPLPPRWALGNLQSRMAYRNQKEADSIVTLMQKKMFPMDALILDFYWFGDSILGHLGRLDWYKKAWPDPEGMIRKFRQQGVKTILITEPYIIDSVPNFKDAVANNILCTDSLGKPYVNHQFYFGPGGLIDIFKPAAREWFWKKYDKHIKMGVAGWWGDLGEPESHPEDLYHINGKADAVHNIYGHYWDRMLFEKYLENYPETRLFHLQRSGFAGSQRYGAYPWTGDVARSWSGYRAQLPLLLTMSMSGLGYIHSDAGGFAQGLKDDELYIRWLQFATFTPIFRPHGSGIPSEPVFWSKSTQDIVRSTIELRYSMLPYNYTLAWENATTGAPLMRPLFYYHPNDETAVKTEDEYYWGPGLLVAPVIEKEAKSRRVYLPKGTWYDFFSDQAYEGKKSHIVNLTIDKIPVFIKKGAIVPMISTIMSTDHYVPNQYNLTIAPDSVFQFIQYEDDGLDNQALLNHQYELITYQGTENREMLKLSISKTGSWKGMPSERIVNLKVIGAKQPDKVLIHGKKIKYTHPNRIHKITSGDYYYTRSGNYFIHFNWQGEPINIQVIY